MSLKRFLYADLLEWKKKANRKPLLLQGARQVGKTFLINQFGQNEYKNYVYFNFEQNQKLSSLFKENLKPEQIIQNLSIYVGEKIGAEETLICFDEIQNSPSALTSLKYFQEEAPQYHIIAAGSLLGLQVSRATSFPVGKIHFLTLYPLSFSEYLDALQESLLSERLLSNRNAEPLPEILHDKLNHHLKMYLYLGGMPEVVNNYLATKDIAMAREIQNEILKAYAFDFSKYSTATESIRVSEIWRSIPYQLSKEKKKFKYNEVQQNARSSAYEQSIQWLLNAGLIHQVFNIRTPKLPLSGYADHSKFKIYLLDTGLLGAMLNLTSAIIIQPNKLFTEYNGAFIENFIANELIKTGITELFYWTSPSIAEVDYVFQHSDSIFPLEVKSGNSRNLSSIRSYDQKYSPEKIFRCSPRNFTKSNKFFNLPLYAAHTILNYLAPSKEPL